MRTLRDPLLILILFVSLVVGASVLTRGHEWGDDFASYIMQARSIWEGRMQEFVEHNRFTIQESSIVIGPVAYPWGYPLILAPAYAWKGISPLALKIPGLLLFFGFLICLFLLMKNRLTRTESLVLVALFAFNPLLIKFLNQILSDIPFLFFSTLALLLMVNRDRQSMRDHVVIGAVTAFAFFIRATGLLLLVSFLSVEFLTLWKDRADAAAVKKGARNLLALMGTFGSLWVLYALIFPGGSESYLALYSEFRAGQVVAYARAYFGIFGMFFGETPAWTILYDVVSVFFLIGLWVRRREDELFIAFFLFWMLLLMTWPDLQGPRFIFPLLPIFMYFAFQGIKYATQKLPERWRLPGQRAFLALWLVVAGLFLFNSAVDAYDNLVHERTANGPYDYYSTEAFEFIRQNTPADSVIVFYKPRAMRLFTGRDSFMSFDCERLALGDYAVLNKKAENSQVTPDQIDECPGISIQVEFESRRFLVFKILK